METSPLRAAEYMRMSTDHQQYSIANQSAAIQEYANTHSIEIVRTYVDRGKSGLALDGRTGLQDLLRVGTSGTADFTLVLVYDVSRWGRFQDVDESAHHEYMLRQAGVRVIYCAEPFHETGTPTDAIIKALKRAMAAEYSRELSVKVSAGQRRNAQMGFRNGGLAGFGFRRVAVEPGGSRRTVLMDGERKAIKNDRVTLERGPEEEVRTVQKLFALFLNDGLTEQGIAKHLNERGVLTRQGNPWSRETIHRILIDPKYVGDLAYNRTLTHLGALAVPNPRENWTYVPNQYPGAVSREIWNEAQEALKRRAERGTEEEMLARLRALYAKHGRLSYDLIDAEPGMLSAQTYQHRFGSITEAYRRVGWTARRHRPQNTRCPEVRVMRNGLDGAVTNRIADIASDVLKHPKVPVWTVIGELSICVMLVVATKNQKKRVVWRLSRKPPNGPPDPDVLVMARLNIEATAILDYYVFPGDCPMPIRIFEVNPWPTDMHRFDDLSFLDLIFGRTKLSTAGGFPV